MPQRCHQDHTVNPSPTLPVPSLPSTHQRRGRQCVLQWRPEQPTALLTAQRCQEASTGTGRDHCRLWPPQLRLQQGIWLMPQKRVG